MATISELVNAKELLRNKLGLSEKQVDRAIHDVEDDSFRKLEREGKAIQVAPDGWMLTEPQEGE